MRVGSPRYQFFDFFKILPQFTNFLHIDFALISLILKLTMPYLLLYWMGILCKHIKSRLSYCYQHKHLNYLFSSMLKIPDMNICCHCYLVPKSCPTLLWHHGLLPARSLCPWDFPGKNTGVGCHLLFQGIFPTKGSKLGSLASQVDSLPTRKSLWISKKVQ